MPTTTISNWGDAVFLSLSNALNSFLAAIPLVIGALVIIVIGWIIAGVLARLSRKSCDEPEPTVCSPSMVARSTAAASGASSRAVSPASWSSGSSAWSSSSPRRTCWGCRRSASSSTTCCSGSRT